MKKINQTLAAFWVDLISRVKNNLLFEVNFLIETNNLLVEASNLFFEVNLLVVEKQLNNKW